MSDVRLATFSRDFQLLLVIFILSNIFICHQLFPYLEGSPWRCDGCGKVVGVSLVQSKLKLVLDVIAENRHEDNLSLMKVISLLEKSLHPNHYLILGIKEIIIQRLMQSIVASKLNKGSGLTIPLKYDLIKTFI